MINDDLEDPDISTGPDYQWPGMTSFPMTHFH